MQRVRERGSGHVTVVGVLSHCLFDNLFYGSRDIGNDFAGRGHGFVNVLEQHSHRSVGRVGFASGQHLVEKDTQSVNVNAMIHLATSGGLLWRHVLRRSHGGCHVLLLFGPALIQQYSDAEVRQHHLIIQANEHIGGLNVTVQDTLSMGVLHSPRKRQHLLYGRLPTRGFIEFLAQSAAGDIFSHQIQVPIVFSEIMHVENVRVAHLAESASFLLEAFDHLLGAHAVATDELDGHRSPQAAVISLVDGCHAAFTQQLGDLVAFVSYRLADHAEPFTEVGGAADPQPRLETMSATYVVNCAIPTASL